MGILSLTQAATTAAATVTTTAAAGGLSAETATGISAWFSQYGSTIFLILIMVVMFAVMIIPQRKREKKVKEMLAAIKSGDRVRTIGGIYGTVTSVKDDIITLAVGPEKVKLVFARGAISSVEDSAVENTMSEEVKEIK